MLPALVVEAELARSHRHGFPVNDRVARTIAAAWASPRFLALAHLSEYGCGVGEAVAGEARALRARLRDDPNSTAGTLASLYALEAWASCGRVRGTHSGHRTATGTHI